MHNRSVVRTGLQCYFFLIPPTLISIFLIESAYNLYTFFMYNVGVLTVSLKP